MKFYQQSTLKRSRQSKTVSRTMSSIILTLAIATSAASMAQTPIRPEEPRAAAPSQDSAPTSAAGPSGAFFYYCYKTNSYFPAVQDCPNGWIAVPVGTAFPVAQTVERESATQETVESKPNAISLEILGRATTYSLDYDHSISKHLTLGIGISSWQDHNWWRDYNATVTVIPLYANYYFSQIPTRGFVSVGADWISVSEAGYNNSTFTNNGFAAVVGGGWESMSKSGFLLRLGGYLIVGRTTTISPSVVLGYAF